MDKYDAWNDEKATEMGIQTLKKILHNKLHTRVIKFMNDNKISCSEDIYQSEWAIGNAYEFIGDLYEIVKYDLENQQVKD